MSKDTVTSAPGFRLGGALGLILRFAMTNGWLLLANIVTGVLTARILGKAGRGEYAAMLFWPSILSATFVLGLPASVIFNIKKKTGKEESLVTTALVLSLIYGIIGGIVGLIIIDVSLTNYAPFVVRTSQFLMLTVPIGVPIYVLMTVLLAQEHFTMMNRCRYFNQGLLLFSFITLIIFHCFTPLSAVIVTSLAPIIVIPIVLWKYIREFRFDFSDFKKNARQLILDGFLFALVDLSSTISSQFDSVTVLKGLSVEQNGVYSLASSIAKLVSVLQDATAIILLPKSVDKSDDMIVEITSRTLRFLLVILIGIVVVFWMLIPLIIRVVYGNFEEAIPVARLLSVAAMFTGLFLVLGQALMALKKPHIFAICQMGGTVLCIPLMIYAVKVHGLIGAGFVFALSGLIRFVFLLLCFPLVLKRPVPGLILQKEDIKWIRSMVVKA